MNMNHINKGARLTFLTSAGLISGVVLEIGSDGGLTIYHLDNVTIRSHSDFRPTKELPHLCLFGDQIIGFSPAIDRPI